MAQHEILELTTYVTNLRLTDTWKGTTQQILTHFKEKLHLLDSLVEDSDKIPQTTHIGFLQQAVESGPATFDRFVSQILFGEKDWIHWHTQLPNLL